MSTETKIKVTQKAVCHSDNPLKNRPFCANTALKDHGTRKRYRGLLLCLTQKCLVFKCFAVLPLQNFSCKDGLKPQEYCRISRLKTCLRGKRSRQNRVSHCGAPPKDGLYFFASPAINRRCFTERRRGQFLRSVEKFIFMWYNLFDK